MDRSINIWRLDNGVLLDQLGGHEGGITSLAFGPNGRMIVSGSTDKSIGVWMSLLDVPYKRLDSDDVRRIRLDLKRDDLDAEIQSWLALVWSMMRWRYRDRLAARKRASGIRES